MERRRDVVASGRGGRAERCEGGVRRDDAGVRVAPDVRSRDSEFSRRRGEREEAENDSLDGRRSRRRRRAFVRARVHLRHHRTRRASGGKHGRGRVALGALGLASDVRARRKRA